MNFTASPVSSGSAMDFQAYMVNKIIITVYGIISLGFFSNVAVGIVVANILVRLGRTLPNRHMLVYVLALCIVDALVLGTLPMLITQLYLNTWIFGQTLCTVYWTIESINKTLSTLILTCLSFDRYLAVRFPQRCMNIRTVRGALYILFACIVFAALILMPVYLHARVQIENDAKGPNGTDIYVCAFGGQTSFILTLFILCYLVPFACMSFFYGSMLARLRHKTKKLGLRQSRVRRVTKKTLTLVILYFAFWTPYWAMTLHTVITVHLANERDALNATEAANATLYVASATSSAFVTAATHLANATQHGHLEAETEGGGDVLSVISFAAMLVVHSGTYLNSAINPILYALLNMELRRQHSAAMNGTGGRSTAGCSTANTNDHRNGNGRGSINMAQQQTHPLIDGRHEDEQEETLSSYVAPNEHDEQLADCKLHLRTARKKITRSWPWSRVKKPGPQRAGRRAIHFYDRLFSSAAEKNCNDATSKKNAPSML